MNIESQMFHSEAQKTQYYSGGYTSLTDFCKQAFSGNPLLCEANPGLAYNGYALSASAEIRADLLRAKTKLLRHAAGLIETPDPVYIEFGVRAGVSMQIVSSAVSAQGASFYGLDTFTGLPDGWVAAYGNRGRGVSGSRPVGAMAVERMPDFSDRRIVLVKGLFQDTLPVILPQLGRRRLFVNYDGDTYTAALYGLTMLHPYMKAGDIIHFDEFVDEINEFAAFNDYVRSFYVRDRFKLIGRAYDAFLFQMT